MSAICQKLSDWNLAPPGLSPMRTQRSRGTPTIFVHSSYASSSVWYTVVQSRSGGSLYTLVSSSHAKAIASFLK